MSSSTVLFAKHNRVNVNETFLWRCGHHDLKFHKSSDYVGNRPFWRTWKGGFRLRGENHKVFNKYFHQRYTTPMAHHRIKRFYGCHKSSDFMFIRSKLNSHMKTSFS